MKWINHGSNNLKPKGHGDILWELLCILNSYYPTPSDNFIKINL